MTDIVERLKALVILDEVRSDNPLGREAAAEIERLRKDLSETALEALSIDSRATTLSERLAEAVELLHKVYFASRIDVLMEGPRLSGWNRPELDRLWPELRDLVAKLEGRSDAIRAMEEKP